MSRALFCVPFVLAACLPSATVAPAEPIPTAEVEAAPSGPRHARMTGTIVLHADPSASAHRLELLPGLGTSSDRIVELLEARDGWWRVRTLLPREVMALGLDAGMGVAVLSLEGWVEPGHVFELAPGSGSASVQPPASVTPAEADPGPTAPVLFGVRAGTRVLWPDGRVAGEAVEDHYFFFPATARQAESPDGPRTLWCHERRAAPGLGRLEGWLCSSEQDAKDTEVDTRIAVALDQPNPHPEAGGAKIDGALDKDIIRRIVRAHINEIRGCYNDGLLKDPALTGRVAIEFVIKADGLIGDAVVAEDTLADPEVGKCIVKAVKTWRFPKPLGGGNVTVLYPFNLVPG